MVWRNLELGFQFLQDGNFAIACGDSFNRRNFAGRGAILKLCAENVIGWNDPYTVRQACLAMENMDLTELVPKIERPLLMTNGTYDILCPPELAPSGLGARRMAAMNPRITTHEFPDIGHADLLECPAEAVRIVGDFFRSALRD